MQFPSFADFSPLRSFIRQVVETAQSWAARSKDGASGEACTSPGQDSEDEGDGCNKAYRLEEDCDRDGLACQWCCSGADAPLAYETIPVQGPAQKFSPFSDSHISVTLGTQTCPSNRDTVHTDTDDLVHSGFQDRSNIGADGASMPVDGEDVLVLWLLRHGWRDAP